MLSSYPLGDTVEPAASPSPWEHSVTSCLPLLLGTQCNQLPPPPLTYSPHHDGLYSQAVGQNKSIWPSWIWIFRYFMTAIRNVNSPPFWLCIFLSGRPTSGYTRCLCIWASTKRRTDFCQSELVSHEIANVSPDTRRHGHTVDIHQTRKVKAWRSPQFPVQCQV